jgi:hypothetical protein
MAKTFVSPGVFTNEIDASFLGAGVGSIGAALIGTAPQGPAFVPVTVTNFSEFTSYFGDLDTDSYLGYAARAYLKNAGSANVVRVLGPEGRTVNGSAVTAGYNADSMWSINAITGSVGAVCALLELTGNASLIISDLANDQFSVRITGSTLAGADGNIIAVTASFLTSSTNYIKKVLNTDPTLFSSQGYYLRQVYDYAYFYASKAGNALYNSSSHAVVTNFAFGYNSGSTPWIKSQLFGGTSEYNMLRVHTLGHGNAENGRFKISIKNIRAASNPAVNEYGKFDLEVRTFNDTDKSRSVVESFPNLTFDPQDPNYVAKAVGTKYFLFDFNRTKMVEYGDYDNRSKLIRVEMSTGSFPAAALPWGYRGLVKPNLTISGSGSGIVASGIPDLPLVKDLKDKESQSEAQSYIYWGLETILSGNVSARFNRFSAMTGSDTDFSLTNVSGSAIANLVYNASNTDSRKSPGASTTNALLEPALAKFTVPVAFGFDGFDVRLADPISNETQLASISQLGTQALRQAVDIISDPDFIDINMLAIPGVYSSKVVDYAINKIQDRADAFYVIDISGSSVTAVVQEVNGRGFDSNYASVYYPSIRVNDDVNGVVKTLPASIAAIGVIAFSDRVSYPWFAPAGLNRAGLSRDTIGFDVLSITDPLKADERDSLYEARINPIARFPDVPQGVIWGQKTLQLKSSALDRINVRRLLIRAKKLVASAIKYLVFEPNNPATQTRFRQLVNPILADIQQKQGLTQFKVVMDETTNTPDLIDRNILAGKIFLVPTRSAEFISVDFVISKTGATFTE